MEVKWQYIAVTIILGVLAIAAALYLAPSPREETIEEGWVGYEEPVMKHIGGKFNTTLFLMARLGEYESGDIVYIRDGVERRGYYISALEQALNYLKTNTPPDSTILAWWDYGNMIIGYGEREAIAINPSEKLLIGITNTSAAIKTDPEEKLEDIAKALVATDPNDTLTIMKKYGSEFILVPTGIFGDEGKAQWIFFAAGVPLDDMDDYWEDGRIVSKGIDTVLDKMLNKKEVPGFTLVFSDKDTRIYQVVS